MTFSAAPGTRAVARFRTDDVTTADRGHGRRSLAHGLTMVSTSVALALALVLSVLSGTSQAVTPDAIAAVSNEEIVTPEQPDSVSVRIVHRTGHVEATYSRVRGRGERPTTNPGVVVYSRVVIASTAIASVTVAGFGSEAKAIHSERAVRARRDVEHDHRTAG